MLTTVLYILKIIGIVLLCILGFVLVVILLVLFCPWKYCIDVSKETQLAGRARVYWLFYFLIADVLYQDGVNIRCRVLGIVVYDKQRRERKAAERAEKKAAKKNKNNRQPQLKAADVSEDVERDVSAVSVPDKNTSAADRSEPDILTLEDSVRNSSKEDHSSKERTDEKEEKDSKGKCRNKKRRVWWEFPQYFFELIIEWIEKAVDFLFRLPEILGDWAEHLEEKIEDLIDKYDYYTKLLQKKGSVWVISFLKKEVFSLLKHICPKRSKINITYANEDPANVANMMAYYGMAMPFLPKHTTFTAELGEPRLAGTIKIKGRVFLIFILCHGLKVFFNKKVRMFLKLLKREEE